MLRLIVLVLIFRPLVRLFAGADVVGRGRLPATGPAIVVANHTSHMDTLLLLTLFPARAISRVHPAAAADYFLSNPALAWFSRNVIGIIPVDRSAATRGEDALAPTRAALERGDIVVVFPEGTRGSAAGGMGPLKNGVARLVSQVPAASVVPVWIQGAGRVMPKGAHLPVPLTCCVLVGEPLAYEGDRAGFMATLKTAFETLEAQAPPLRWRS